jgi:hypothetical protein
MAIDNACQLKIYCNGTGTIEFHAVNSDLLLCVTCMARRLETTQKVLRENVRTGEYAQLVHRARSTDHRC